MDREYKTTEEMLVTAEEEGLITIWDGRITYEGTKYKKSYQFTDPEEPVCARIQLACSGASLAYNGICQPK